MMYLRFITYLLADIAVNLIGYVINPALPLFANREGNLPKWLRWFQTQDSTLDGTEPRFIAATKYLRGANGEPRNVIARYLLRVMWLYRNNAYGFAYHVLGARVPFTMLYEDSEYPSDRFPAVEGSYMAIFTDATGKRYFHYKLVKDRGNGKCFEASVGWKRNGQFVCRWTPFRKFNG